MYSLKKEDTLKKNEEFGRVYREGRSSATPLLVLYTLKKEGQENTRIGISVSKKVGNSIVRHRLKRQIREAFRLNRHALLCGYDLVVIARNQAKGRDYKELEHALLQLALVRNILNKE